GARERPTSAAFAHVGWRDPARVGSHLATSPAELPWYVTLSRSRWRSEMVCCAEQQRWPNTLTKRSMAQHQLDASSLHAILGHTPAFIYVMDLNFYVLYMNRFQPPYSAEDTIGHHID